ncbi:hypothetical protein DDP54_17225 [Cellulomonas sp. WB94]|nr:hypothetical protein DDP54_17225 [Cellulomonas sp. WB94]
MKPLRAQAVWSNARGSDREAGIAMVIAVAVIMLVSAVVATILVLVLRENGLSGRERQRAVSIASAEGQVDELVSQIDHASVSSLTDGTLCGTVPAFTSRVGRDDLTVTSTVTYFQADGSPMNCADVASGAIEARTAAVRATTTSTPLPNKAAVVRHFETIINLHLNVNMKQAIFGNDGVTITNNNTVVNGENGANNGDVYSNGYVNCRGQIYGSVYAGTTVTFENDCDWIAGDVWAVGNVTANPNSMTMVGDIKSSSGSIFLNQLGAQSNKVFGGKAWAHVAVSGSACPSAKCNSGQSINPPPTATFPELTDAHWTEPVTDPPGLGLGFTTITFPTCIADFGNPASLGYWLKNSGPTLTQNTLVRMPNDCTVDFTNVNGQVMYLNKDVAIFARGLNANGQAFNITGRPHFVGTPGALKNLYFIQDYHTPDCTKVGIDVNNHITADENIRLLMYTPNKFYSASGNSEIIGQIFSGCVAEINNVMDLSYSLLPVTGIQNISAMSYSAEIVAKRETS